MTHPFKWHMRLATVLTSSLGVSLHAFAASVGGRGDLRPLAFSNTACCLCVGQMKGCIKVLKEQPSNSVEGLLNALRCV